jgi:hypothetical protein
LLQRETSGALKILLKVRIAAWKIIAEQRPASSERHAEMRREIALFDPFTESAERALAHQVNVASAREPLSIYALAPQHSGHQRTLNELGARLRVLECSSIAGKVSAMPRDPAGQLQHLPAKEHRRGAIMWVGAGEVVAGGL